MTSSSHTESSSSSMQGGAGGMSGGSMHGASGMSGGTMSSSHTESSSSSTGAGGAGGREGRSENKAVRFKRRSLVTLRSPERKFKDIKFTHFTEIPENEATQAEKDADDVIWGIVLYDESDY